MIPANCNYNGVLIRTVDYLEGKDVALPGAFLKKTKEKIPVMYQYCQTKQPNDTANSYIIGYATNFRVSDQWMVCDVVINPLTKHGNNFEGSIDNYTINVRQKGSDLVFDLTRLIIYDKDFKAERDRQIIEHAKLLADVVNEED